MLRKGAAIGCSDLVNERSDELTAILLNVISTCA